jgi:hypothetical protein
MKINIFNPCKGSVAWFLLFLLFYRRGCGDRKSVSYLSYVIMLEEQWHLRAGLILGYPWSHSLEFQNLMRK